MSSSKAHKARLRAARRWKLIRSVVLPDREELKFMLKRDETMHWIKKWRKRRKHALPEAHPVMATLRLYLRDKETDFIGVLKKYSPGRDGLEMGKTEVIAAMAMLEIELTRAETRLLSRAAGKRSKRRLRLTLYEHKCWHRVRKLAPSSRPMRAMKPNLEETGKWRHHVDSMTGQKQYIWKKKLAAARRRAARGIEVAAEEVMDKVRRIANSHRILTSSGHFTSLMSMVMVTLSAMSSTVCCVQWALSLNLTRWTSSSSFDPDGGGSIEYKEFTFAFYNRRALARLHLAAYPILVAQLQLRRCGRSLSRRLQTLSALSIMMTKHNLLDKDIAAQSMVRGSLLQGGSAGGGATS